MSPVARKKVVQRMEEAFGLSQRRACELAGQHRSVQRYESCRSEDPELLSRLKSLADERPRFGYRRLGILLGREGLKVNHKRLYRIYAKEGLAVRKKRKRRVSTAPRQQIAKAEKPLDGWSMDFMTDGLSNGRAIRLFNVVDDVSKVSVAIEVDFSMPSRRVCRLLDQAIEEWGKPNFIRADNGPEFRSKALDAWAYQRGILLEFIDPGRPTQNGFIESFNGRVREECLNLHWFESLGDARKKLAAWRTDYNHVRPHTSLGGLAPLQFLHAEGKALGPCPQRPMPLQPKSGPLQPLNQ